MGSISEDFKKRRKEAQAKAKKPLFVSLVLENLSRIYEKFILQRDSLEILQGPNYIHRN